MEFTKEPLNNIEWVAADSLIANDYNPNVVMDAEMKLLKYSIIKNGWIQPILINGDPGTIIDGFHRNWLARNDLDIKKAYAGKCPVVRFDLTEPERMLLTIRINRAKGSHVAFKMHECITTVVKKYNYSKPRVANAIGATVQEVELLLKQDVFAKLNTANHKYSAAWIPK